jgi:hypothetical protein
MKKYLMSGLAVLAMAFVAASCSSDDVYDASRSKVQDQYDAAFIRTFGKPASNQDWGFGTLYTNYTRSTAFTRAIQPTFNFPGDADASKFLDDVPAGIELLTSGIGRANHYIDETYEGDVNVWGMGTEAGGWQDKSGGILYVKGNCDFSNRSFYFGGNSELYLVKGATLTLGENNGSGNLQSGTMIYIAEGAKLIANGVLHLNNGLHIYNHGTIETPQLSTNNTSVLYNVGTVTVENRISVENTLSVIVNDGTITAADLNTAGSGKFENNNKVTISGTTFVNSNENTWVNNGQYHTGSFIYYAASDEVINNCKLTVDEDFGINLADNDGNGNFKMDAGSSVVTKNFYGGGNWSGTYAGTWCDAQGGPFYIYMGAGSVFKVTGTATMNASKENYGIYGPTDGSSYDGVSFAVFEAKNVVMGKENQGFEVTYGGNLAVVAENHFANGNDGREDHPFIDFKGNARIYAPGFTSGKPAITIQSSECNPGFNGGGNIPVNYDVRIIAEDLSATESSDFDFNDVVFDVHFTSNTAAVVTLRAAGGTLPLRFMRNDELEVHKLFGYGDNTSVMINTDATARGYQTDPEADHKEPVEFAIESGLDRDTNKGNDIIIEVKKNGVWYEITAVKGKPAAKLAVAPQFPWVMEKVPMTSVYDRFSGWVQNPDVRWY